MLWMSTETKKNKQIASNYFSILAITCRYLPLCGCTVNCTKGCVNEHIVSHPRDHHAVVGIAHIIEGCLYCAARRVVPNIQRSGADSETPYPFSKWFLELRCHLWERQIQCFCSKRGTGLPENTPSRQNSLTHLRYGGVKGDGDKTREEHTSSRENMKGQW